METVKTYQRFGFVHLPGSNELRIDFYTGLVDEWLPKSNHPTLPLVYPAWGYA
tara:strand:- start:303 stop:461 length:159 start_codon:yes stop_codon:yes gene_type:complete